MRSMTEVPREVDAGPCGGCGQEMGNARPGSVKHANTIASGHTTLARETSKRQECFLAALEPVKAASPETRMYAPPAGLREVQPARVGFASGIPGLLRPPVGIRARQLRRRLPALPAAAGPPESALPTTDLRRTFAMPGVAAAHRSCDPRRFSRGSTGALPASEQSAPGGGSKCR